MLSTIFLRIYMRPDKGSPWVYGVLLNNVWSTTSNKQGGGYSNGLIQPFVNYNFESGAYLTTAPIATSPRHKATPTSPRAVPSSSA